LSKQLFRSTATVGAMTLISRVLGFTRDVVIAKVFGAGMDADAFFVAFRIPNLLRRLFAEGAFSQAFVPVLSQYKAQRSHGEVRMLVNHLAWTLAAVLFLITALGVLAAPFLVMMLAPGFAHHADKFDLTVSMLRVTFPYLFFISLAALAAGILNTYGRFAVPAFTPVFLNLSIIGAALWLAPNLEQPVTSLAWGVFIGGMVQLGFQLSFLLKLRLLPIPIPKFKDEGTRRVLGSMGPAIFGVSVAQINLLIDTLIASFLATGSVSWLYYSDRLVEFPLGVFGIALGTVILPHLSEKHTAGSSESFSRMLDWALRWTVAIGVPASLGLIILAGPILCTLFQYGEFMGHDVLMSSRSLTAYAFGLLAFILIKVLAPGYYSRQDIRTPVRIGVIAMVSNIVMNLVLVFPLAHAGLALATAFSAYLNAWLLYYGLRRAGVYRPLEGWRGFLLKVLIANGLMALVLSMGAGDLAEWQVWVAGERIWRLIALLVGGGAIYLVSLWALGLRWEHMMVSRSTI